MGTPGAIFLEKSTHRKRDTALAIGAEIAVIAILIGLQLPPPVSPPQSTVINVPTSTCFRGGPILVSIEASDLDSTFYNLDRQFNATSFMCEGGVVLIHPDSGTPVLEGIALGVVDIGIIENYSEFASANYTYPDMGLESFSAFDRGLNLTFWLVCDGPPSAYVLKYIQFVQTTVNETS